MISNLEKDMSHEESQAKVSNEQNRCYRVQDLEAILGIGRASVYKLLKRKEFRWIKIGDGYRIPRKSFDAWLEAQEE